MSLTYQKQHDHDREDAAMYVSPTRLYLTVDGRVVEEGDHAAHQLLVPAGGRLSRHLAEHYGLTDRPVPPEPDTKHVEAPPATKAVTRKRTKGSQP